MQRLQVRPTPGVNRQQALGIEGHMLPLQLPQLQEALHEAHLDHRRAQHLMAPVVAAHRHGSLGSRCSEATSLWDLSPVTHRLRIHIGNLQHITQRGQEAPQPVKGRPFR